MGDPAVTNMAFYVMDGMRCSYNDTAVRNLGRLVTKSNNTGRAFPTMRLLTFDVGKTVSSSSAFANMNHSPVQTTSILLPVITGIQKLVCDDFASIGNDPVALATLINRFYTACKEQSVATMEAGMLFMEVQRIELPKYR